MSIPTLILATFIYIYITINDVVVTIDLVKGLFSRGSHRYSNCQTQTMAANECWISAKGVKMLQPKLKREECLDSLLGRVHCQNPETVEKTATDIVVK